MKVFMAQKMKNSYHTYTPSISTGKATGISTDNETATKRLLRLSKPLSKVGKCTLERVYFKKKT